MIIYENIKDSIFNQTWDSQDRFSKIMIVENLNLFQSDFIIVFKYTRLNNGPFLGEDHRVCRNDTLFYQKFRSVWLLTGLGNIRLEAVRCIPLHFAITNG